MSGRDPDNGKRRPGGGGESNASQPDGRTDAKDTAPSAAVHAAPTGALCPCGAPCAHGQLPAGLDVDGAVLYVMTGIQRLAQRALDGGDVPEVALERIEELARLTLCVALDELVAVQ